MRELEFGFSFFVSVRKILDGRRPCFVEIATHGCQRQTCIALSVGHPERDAVADRLSFGYWKPSWSSFSQLPFTSSLSHHLTPQQEFCCGADCWDHLNLFCLPGLAVFLKPTLTTLVRDSRLESALKQRSSCSCPCRPCTI